jgi:hypothetical protein
MLRKSLFLIGLAATWQTTNAFTAQDQPGMTGPSNWAVLTVLFLVIIVVAILLIVQKQMTPESIARYHLDHGAHEFEAEGHAPSVALAEVEASSDEPPAADEPAAPEEDRMA